MIGIFKILFNYSIAALLIMPQYCAAQNFNTVFDHDSTDDLGYDIFEKADGSYLTFCAGIKNGRWNSYTMNISRDGQSLLSQSDLSYPGGWFDIGPPGKIKRLSDGTFLVPLSVRWDKYTASGQAISPGIALLDSNGQVIFSKVFVTDTSCCNRYIYDCVKNNLGEYYIAGLWTNRTTGAENGMLMKMDSSGDLIWEKQYNRFSLPTVFNSIQLVGNDRIVLGGTVEYLLMIHQPPLIRFCKPWFSLLDTSGNVIRDTIYQKGFAGVGIWGGGVIYKDVNGGYYHYGSTAIIYDSSDVDWVENFPDYLAHLDDSFRITWIKIFTDRPNHKYIWKVQQLHDGCYLVMNGKNPPIRNGFGWAAKVDKNGNEIWDNTYFKDTTIWDNNFTDAVELEDHSIVFTGGVIDGSQPSWHKQDAWFVRVDSNGCEMPGCVPTSIEKLPIEVKDVLFYPNPVGEELTIEGLVPNERIQLFNLLGVKVYEQTSVLRKEHIDVSRLSSGTYLLQVTNTGGERKVFKVVKQ